MLDLISTSRALAQAAEDGRWDEVSRQTWLRADILDGLRDEPPDPAALRAAYQAGERARAAVQLLRASLETELINLRAARRASSAWRPYREASGASVDVSS
jgi:hypothetical protein